MHKLGLASLRGPEEPQGTEGNPRTLRVSGIPGVPRDPPPPLLHEAKYIPSVSVPPCALCALAGESHGIPVQRGGRSAGRAVCQGIGNGVAQW